MQGQLVMLNEPVATISCYVRVLFVILKWISLQELFLNSAILSYISCFRHLEGYLRGSRFNVSGKMYNVVHIRSMTNLKL